MGSLDNEGTTKSKSKEEKNNSQEDSLVGC
jgi:hypothetical protein